MCTICISEATISSLASKLVSRLNALGVTKDGKPLVVDQGFEAIAAMAGYRNQHAFRKALAATPNQTKAQPLEFKPVGAQLFQRMLTPDGAAYIPVLKEFGYSVEISEFKRPFWQRDDEASEDFDTEAEAWASALADFNEKNLWEKIRPVDPAEEQMEALEKKFSPEHPWYTQEDWRMDLENRDTQLTNYWEWLSHQLESNGGIEWHCTECHRPFHGEESVQGKCMTCAGQEDSPEVPLDMRTRTAYSFALGALSRTNLEHHAQDLAVTWRGVSSSEVRSELLDVFDQNLRGAAEATCNEFLDKHMLTLVSTSGWMVSEQEGMSYLERPLFVEDPSNPSKDSVRVLAKLWLVHFKVVRFEVDTQLEL